MKLYGTLNKEGLLSQFIIFHRIKYLSHHEGSDKKGGFVNKSDTDKIAKELNISKSLLCTNLRLYASIGWAVKSPSGYRLVGWRYFRKYAPDLEKITIFDNDKLELLIKIAERYFKTNLVKQRYRKLTKFETPQRLHAATNMALLGMEEFSVSVRTLAKVLGFSSPTMGSRFEKILEQRRKIVVHRRRRLVCKLDEYVKMQVHKMADKKRCYVENGLVYERLCNNVIPVYTSEDAQRDELNHFNRQYAIRRRPFKTNFIPFVYREGEKLEL